MIRYQSAIDVTRSPEEAFDAIVDPARWGDWTDMSKIKPMGGGPLGVGSSGEFRFAKGPFRGPVRYEVTELDRGRRVAYRITHPAFDWRSEITVAQRAGGSRVTTSGSMRLHGLWRLLQPIVASEVRRGEAGELERLRAMLESRGPEGDAEPASGTAQG